MPQRLNDNKADSRISEDYRTVDDLIMVGVLKGSFVFMADLSRGLTVPRSIEFLALSTYGNNTTTNGAVRLILDVRRNISGRHVLVVEDIIVPSSKLGGDGTGGELVRSAKSSFHRASSVVTKTRDT